MKHITRSYEKKHSEISLLDIMSLNNSKLLKFLASFHYVIVKSYIKSYIKFYVINIIYK